MSTLLRFFAVTVLGVMLDLVIAAVLHAYLGVALWIAAAIGFAVAASANYVIHQTWSFRNGSRQLSTGRAMKYAVVALVTLAVRVLIVGILDRAHGEDLALVILACGAGGSFFVNFALSRYVVFSADPARPSAS